MNRSDKKGLSRGKEYDRESLKAVPKEVLREDLRQEA
jgi:hypothetical protein